MMMTLSERVNDALATRAAEPPIEDALSGVRVQVVYNYD